VKSVVAVTVASTMFLNCMSSSLSSGAPAEVEPCVPQAELEL